MIVADASWVIALHDPRDLLHERAKEACSEAGDDATLLHPVTLAECLVGPTREGHADIVFRELRLSYKVPEVKFDAPTRWARLRARTNLRLPDAIVLDTALHHQADTISTFDEKLAAAARVHGLEVLGA